MNGTSSDHQNKTGLDRALSVFADVRGGEALTALLLAINVFLLLGAYYIIKPVREALILAGGGGAEIKSYSGAVQAALFMFIVPAYSAYASRVNRIRLINVIFVIFISNLIIFYLLSKTGIPLGIPFFLWIGLFNVMLTAQFWSFANDLYTPEQGKRLFAIVGFGSTIGAVSGSKAAEFLVKSVGVYQMMLVSAGILGISLVLYNIIHKREKAAGKHIDPKLAEAPLGGKSGFSLVMAHKYLLFIGILTLVVNWVNTTGEYILGKSVSQMAKEVMAAGQGGGYSEGQIIGSFYANFQFWQNVVGALIQLFLVSRIIKYVGIRWAIFIHPLISLGSYTLLAAAPILAYIRIAKIAENSTDYSLGNTIRHSLFLPTSRDAKYKAKQAVDTFFWRFGDMMSAVTVFIGAQLMQLPVRNFAIFNAVLVIGWIVIAASLGRRFTDLTAEQPAKAA